MDRGPQRGPVDLFGEVEGHGRGERPRLGSRLVRPARRCDLAKAHGIGGQPAWKHLSKRLFDLVVIPNRGIDLVAGAVGDIRCTHGTHGDVGQHGDSLPHLGDVERLLRLERHLHAGATGEVDVEEPLSTLGSRGQSQQDEGQRADDCRPHPADKLEVGVAEDLRHRQPSQPAVALGEVEGHPRAEDRREQVEHEAEDERNRKTLQLVGAHGKQYERRNQRREIGVNDRGKGSRKAVADRRAHTRSPLRLFPHTFVDQHVGIDRHAHGEDEAGEASQRERRLERDHQRHDEQDVEQHRQVGDEPGEPVIGQHEGKHHDRRQQHRAGTGADRVGTELGADLLLADRLAHEGRRQAAGVEHAHQEIDVRLLEAAGDLAVAGDRAADRRRRQERVVEQDAQPAREPVGRIGKVLAGERAEECRPRGVEREIDTGLQVAVVAG